MLYIVDDDTVLSDALAWMARSRKLTSVRFTSGEQLLAALGLLDIAGIDIAVLGDNVPKRIPYDPAGDCILLDVRMDGINGVAAFEIISREQINKRIPVIFMTGHGDVPMAVDTLKLGAFDFFEKPFNDNLLFDRVFEALALSQKSGELAQVYDRVETLTAREREVLELILLGKMNKVIADDLGISMRTVEVHRANIFDKMEVKTAVELAGLLK